MKEMVTSSPMAVWSGDFMAVFLNMDITEIGGRGGCDSESRSNFTHPSLAVVQRLSAGNIVSPEITI